MSAEYEMFKRLMQSTVSTAPQSFHDDFVETNAEIRSQSGLKQIVIRQQTGNCCKWCADLVGEWEYKKHPEDVFKRHSNCNCTVEVITEKSPQKSSSKQKNDKQRAVRINREQEILAQAKTRSDEEKLNLDLIMKEDRETIKIAKDIIARPQRVKVASLQKGSKEMGRFYIKEDIIVATQNNRYLKMIRKGDPDFERIMNA